MRKLTVLPHSADGSLESLLNLDQNPRSSNGSRSVGTHSTGVGSDVTVSDSLVILSSREGSDGVTIGEGEDGELGSGEEILDNDLGSCTKEEIYGRGAKTRI